MTDITEYDRFFVDQVRVEKELLNRRLNRFFLYQSGLFVVFQFAIADSDFNGFPWSHLPAWIFGIAILFSLQSTAVITVNVYSQHWFNKQLKIKRPEHPFFVRPQFVGLLGDYSVLLIPYTLLIFWVSFASAYFSQLP